MEGSIFNNPYLDRIMGRKNPKTERWKKAINIVETGRVKEILPEFKEYMVLGDEGKPYKVRHYLKLDDWECNCPDFIYRKRTCKHIMAVQIERS